jgi:hypothetical protein
LQPAPGQFIIGINRQDVIKAAGALLVAIDHTTHPQPGHFIVGVLLNK